MDTRLHGRESRSALVWVAALVAFACLIATAVWFSTRDRTDGTEQTTAASTWSSQPAVEKVAPRTPPSVGVAIPSGVDQVGGYPTKFPRTDLGAVALQIEVAKAQVGFSYATAITVVDTYAALAAAEALEDRARGAVAERRRAAGVPAHGPAPAPAAYAATPIAYTFTELDIDRYAVTILSHITLTTTGGESKDSFYSGTQLVQWIDSDWKLVAGTDADIQHLLDTGLPAPAVPGTDQFRAQGWFAIATETP